MPSLLLLLFVEKQAIDAVVVTSVDARVGISKDESTFLLLFLSIPILHFPCLF